MSKRFRILHWGCEYRLQVKSRIPFLWRDCDLSGRVYHPEQVAMEGHCTTKDLPWLRECVERVVTKTPQSTWVVVEELPNTYLQ